ncbi:hypothetical protein PBRA_009546 [Plasmodiophora brassicae]|uniref:Uncharacterized protein n=1 Tax=Plasmodiophora brassicae TaxID=37360 RepID=A0A0G4J954_PLABS|nr:hypothetical protein PBRA_009546 [Plasmodiophora brassicae]
MRSQTDPAQWVFRKVSADRHWAFGDAENDPGPRPQPSREGNRGQRWRTHPETVRLDDRGGGPGRFLPFNDACIA